MIKVAELTRVFGRRTAVDHVTFRAEPGLVTGFLGPNGAGKTTTMRMVVGLDRPTAGSSTIAGRPYASHPAPLHVAGVLLDAKAVHPGRSARQHLRTIARTHKIPDRRVVEVLELAGLAEVARRRVGTFSLGMYQRLGIAAALLGDPGVLILDEPVNGLDPDGVSWLRSLVRSLAAEGRAVLLSSHLIAEMAQTADRVVVLGRGRIIADDTVAALTARTSRPTTRVSSQQTAQLEPLLKAAGGTTARLAPTTVQVEGLTGEQIARVAGEHHIVLSELAPVPASLEDAFFALTRDAIEYQTVAPSRPSDPLQDTR